MFLLRLTLNAKANITSKIYRKIMDDDDHFMSLWVVSGSFFAIITILKINLACLYYCFCPINSQKLHHYF